MKARSGVLCAKTALQAIITAQTLARDVKVSSKEQCRKICLTSTCACKRLAIALLTNSLVLNARPAG